MSGERIFFGGGLPDASLRPDLGGLLTDVLREEPDSFTYGGLWGDEGLRSLVASRMSRRSGASLDAGNVVLTNGSSGALELLADNLTGPGTVVASEALTYRGALDIFRSRGARIVPVPIDAQGMDVGVLGALAERERPEVVYTIAANHSPTGTTMSPERRYALVELADRVGFTVVQDDTYGEIRFDDHDARPLIGFESERVIHVGSFSKTLAPGLRLGWLAGPATLCEQVATCRTDLGNPPVVQRAVARFLADGSFDSHLERITTVYRAKRDVLLGALAQHCHELGSWGTPEGGFFVWLVLSDGDVDTVAPLAATEGVAFLGGPYFSAAERFGRGIRLAYGEVPAERLAEGVGRLARAITRAIGRP